jgi:UDP-glucose 4-epimerase
MNILVTGATGRIGRTLIPSLLEARHKVRALIIPDDPNTGMIRDMGAQVQVGVLEDSSIYPSVLKDMEAVYHLGGLLPAGNSNDDIFDANIKGTYKLLENIAVNKIALHRFIFASSDEVYPSLKPRYLPLDENHPRYPYSVYGLSKAIGEDFCNLYFREYGIPVVNARFTFTVINSELIDKKAMPAVIFFTRSRLDFLSNINNPPAKIKKEIVLLRKLIQNKGDCLFLACKKDGTYNELPICDTRDLVQGLMLCLEKKEAVGQTIGFGPPLSMTFNKMVEYMSEKIDIPFYNIELPVDLPYNFNFDLSRAKVLLGYKPVWDFYRMIDDAVDKA